MKEPKPIYKKTKLLSNHKFLIYYDNSGFLLNSNNERIIEFDYNTKEYKRINEEHFSSMSCETGEKIISFKFFLEYLEFQVLIYKTINKEERKI